MRKNLIWAAGLIVLGSAGAMVAQIQAFPLAPPPGPQIYPQPLKDDEIDFKPIFDGHSLEGWDGDPRYWRVEDGMIVGVVPPETLLKQNNFLIWRGGAPKNFELKVEYRVSANGNSGVNYRSVEIPGTKWLLRGYQADIDGANKYTGQNYEERGRTFLALRGSVNHVAADGVSTTIASLGSGDELKAFIKKDDWNEYHPYR